MAEFEEQAAELEDIYFEIHELLDRARRAIRGTPEEDRARGYWLAHIACALDDNHGYLGRDMGTMLSSIEALQDRCVDDDPMTPQAQKEMI